MAIDVAAAERFVLANARLVDTLRLAFGSGAVEDQVARVAAPEISADRRTL